MDREFSSLPLSTALLEVVAGLGFVQMTPIQEASIPALLAGKDLVGQSKTGSGKTAAFALPILQRLTLETRALKALVLCPTRELSAQVARELRKLGRNLPGLQVLVLAGGEPLRPQANALERGVHVAVGTPGRVLDHLRREILDLRETETIVLDEADRMLDMGFEEDMEQILQAMPRSRQTVFFSATFPPSIAEMSDRYQQDPVRVTIAADAEDRALMRQLLLTVEPEQKLVALRRVLTHYPHESALIFANFKASVAQLEKALGNAGMSVASLHGDLEQFERDRVMAKFRNASTRVLVATDVAARGIDIENLDLVINYDLPVTPAVYTHRIGRTGRAGKEGLTIAFAGAREQAKIQAIEHHTRAPFERIKLSDMEERAPAEPVDEADPARSEPPPPLQREAKMDTLRIAGGRKQKMRPGDILGALTGEAGGLSGSDIGKIEIHDNFAYVAVAKSVSRRAQQSLSNGKIKGKKFVVSLIK